MDELKAELETAKFNAQEAEKDKANHTQKLKDLKLKLQRLKTTFSLTENEEMKVVCYVLIYYSFRLN